MFHKKSFQQASQYGQKYKSQKSHKFKNFQLTISPKAKYLVIVESPSKCSKIEQYLGSSYQCIASKGHLCYISHLKNIHAPDYQVDFSSKDHVEQMRPLLQHYTGHIFLACDDDREGEAICWHIITLFDLPVTTPRIIFREITQSAILHAIQHPQTINMNTVWSQRARQVLDIMVGFRVSPMLWRFIHSSKKDPLSAGRCQSVALRLVYENEKTMGGSSDSSSNESGRRATFFVSSQYIPFVIPKPFFISSSQDCIDLVHSWRKITNYSLEKITNPQPLSVPPPQPLTTARLLQQFTHHSPHTVMELCQILYQEGHITYMRTDSQQYAPEFIEKCRNFLQGRYPDSFSNNMAATSASTAHEAIRVTDLSLESPNSKDTRINTLYVFIWRTTIQSLMKPAIVEIRKWILHPVEAVCTLNFTRYPGWQYFESKAGDKKEKDGESKVGGEVGEKDPTAIDLFLKLLTIPKPEKILLETLTERPPRHYSESALIHQLEKRGIGRPSTYANIVETLLERGYVNKGDIPGKQTPCKDYIGTPDTVLEEIKTVWVGREYNKLILQPIGQLTIEFLLLNFTDLLSYDYTSRMETELDNIATSLEPQQAYISLCGQCDGHLKEWLRPLRNMTKEAGPILVDSTDDSEYEYKTTANGGYLQNTQTGECKPLRNHLQINLEQLQRGEIDAAQLMEFPGNTDVLGEWQEKPMKFQKSTFGWFLKWGTTNIKIPVENLKRLHEITLEEAILWIPKEEASDDVRLPPPPPGTLRVINSIFSVRKGKYGPYVYNVATQKCISLKAFRQDYIKCLPDEIIQYAEKSVEKSVEKGAEKNVKKV